MNCCNSSTSGIDLRFTLFVDSRPDMSNDITEIERDRFRVNFFAESFSRVLSFLGGLISTILLWRSIAAAMWTTDDYGVIKILTNASVALLPFVLLGINGAVVRVTTEYSTQKDKVGRVVGVTILVVTLVYLAVVAILILFGFERVVLSAAYDVGVDGTSLYLYWILVLITMLPTSYLRISNSIFSGLQQFKRNTYVGIVYSSLRIGILIMLFITRMVNVLNIMVMNLILAILACAISLAQLRGQMKKANIKLNFKPEREMFSKLSTLSAVGMMSALVAAIFSNLTVIWMSTYGTLSDVGFFSIAQGITLTAQMILGASIAVLVPNITREYELGNITELKRKFSEASRITIPTNAFVFAVLFGFATPILRILFGANSIDATLFMQILAFNIIIILLPGLYSNLFLAMNDIKALLWQGIVQVVMQIVWVVVMTPVIGIIAIAMLWVPYMAFFFLTHFYSKRKMKVTIDTRHAGGSVLLGFMFALVMLFVNWLTSAFLAPFAFPDLIDALITACIVIPFWYVYITIAVFARLANSKDLANIENVLRIIPPAWWLTRPLVRRLSSYAQRFNEENSLSEIGLVSDT